MPRGIAPTPESRELDRHYVIGQQGCYPFEIVYAGHQQPFELDLPEPAQEKLPEAQNLFTDFENWLDRLRTKSIAPLGGIRGHRRPHVPEPILLLFLPARGIVGQMPDRLFADTSRKCPIREKSFVTL